MTSKNNIFGFILGLFFWKLLLFINYPFLPSDGPWTLSHLFSLMIGDSNSSTFAHSFYGDVFRTHVLEMLLYPFYVIFPTSTYTFIGISFLSNAFTIFLIYFIFNKQNQGLQIFSMVSLGYLSSVYTYGMRSENYIIPLILVIILLFNYDNLKSSLSTLFLIALFASIVVFIHPMGGVVVVLIIISRLIGYNNFFITGLLLLLFGFFSSILITWGEIQSYVALYIKSRSPSDDHSFWLMGFTKYITYSIGIIPVIFLTMKRNYLQNIIILTIGILVIANFGRSYYFHYLFVILVSIISNPISNKQYNINLDKSFKYFSMICILISLVFTHISPTFLFLENMNLGKEYRQILSRVDIIAKNQKPNHLLWVPAQFGMEVIDQKNARLHYHFYKHTADKKIQLMPGDAMLFYSKSKMDKTLRYQVSNTRDELFIEQVINTTPNYLRIGKFYQQRADSLGLWHVSFGDK